MKRYYVNKVLSDSKTNNYFVVLNSICNNDTIKFIVNEFVAERTIIALESFDQNQLSIYKTFFEFIVKNGWKVDVIKLTNLNAKDLSGTIVLTKANKKFISTISSNDLFILSILLSINIFIDQESIDLLRSNNSIIDENDSLLNSKQDIIVLSKMLDKSILIENYEFAASLRDRIKKIKND